MRHLRLLSLISSGATALAVAGGSAAAPGGPPQGTQPDSQFAASYATASVSNADATTERRSCYRPQVAYIDALPALAGYPGGGGTRCDGASTTGESLGP